MLLACRASRWTGLSRHGFPLARLISIYGQSKGSRTGLDLNNQSGRLPGKEGVRTAIWGLGEQGQFLQNPDASSVTENFLLGWDKAKTKDCLGYRPFHNADYRWLTYAQVRELLHHFGSGLVLLGAAPGQETRIGIYSRNCPEWQIGALGATSQSMVIVPLYDTLGPSSTSYILNHGEISLVICDTQIKAQNLLAAAASTPTLRHIVVMAGTAGLEPVNGIKIHSFADVVKSGHLQAQPLVYPQPSDVYMICYTSGTTGNPKGVVLTHENVMTEIAAFHALFRDYSNFGTTFWEEPTLISYLPLAHVFEQVFEMFIIALGGRIGYLFGEVNHLASDLQALKPSVLPAVPRTLNLLDDRLCVAVKNRGSIAQILFNLGVWAKENQIKRGIYRRDTIWDRLVFAKAQDQIGGNVKIIFSGAAPISGTVLNRCRAVFGCPISSSYGITEASAGCTVTLPMDSSTDHVGPPLPICQIKLIDVPELDYFASENQGEVCVKGPTVMKGYYKDPAATANAIDADGWLHTGDIGTWMENGALKIIDRKGSIIKMSQGEFVSPEKVEEAYSHCDLISNIFVVGKPTEDFLVAIATPKEYDLVDFAVGLGVKGDSFAELCHNRKLVEAVLKELQTIGRQRELNSLEQIQALYLTTDVWSVSEGHLTPTQKTKRIILAKEYATEIDNLYKHFKSVP